MKLIDIENLEYKSLKEGRENCVEAAKTAPIEELAARYVQARTDAKGRDLRLEIQGKTITAQEDSLHALKQKLATIEGNLSTITRQLEAARHQAGESSQTAGNYQNQLKKEIGQLQFDLEKANGRGDRLKAQAFKFAGAMSSIQKAANDAMQAQQILTADESE